jgi:hypothetical protein
MAGIVLLSQPVLELEAVSKKNLKNILLKQNLISFNLQFSRVEMQGWNYLRR